MGYPTYSKCWAKRRHPQAKYVGPSEHSSFPRLWKYSEKRESTFDTPLSWLKSKKEDDGIDKNLWRVHDKLYDLAPFVKSHPGGSEWLTMTQGMDVTELFENSHIVNFEKVEGILKKFYVKEAPHPRNSPYVFEAEGFYKTLKKRVEPILKQVGTNPTVGVRLMQDATAGGFLMFAILAVVYDSYWLVLLSGFLLGLSSVSAHNFFHIKDNWRKYYFDFSLSSHYEWRIEHVFSHHGFPNTALDVEVIWFHPFVEFLTNRKKNKTQRFYPYIYIHLVYSLLFWFQFRSRVVSILKGKQRLRIENLLPVLELILFICYAQSGYLSGFYFWFVLHATCSYWVTMTGLNAAHHHPICFHDGDEARPLPDYGLCMLDATCVKIEDSSRNLFQILTTFGEHNLHHLFPAVCISKIGHIKPIVEKTVKDFEEELIFLTQSQLHTGMHEQFARIEPHSFEYALQERKKTQAQAVWASNKEI